MPAIVRPKPVKRGASVRGALRQAGKILVIELHPEEVALENAILQAAARDVAALR
jgi:hypothetical protein